MSEHRLSGARRPWAIKDNLEEEPPLWKRRLEEEQVVIDIANEEDNLTEEDAKDEEYKEGVV